MDVIKGYWAVLYTKSRGLDFFADKDMTKAMREKRLTYCVVEMHVRQWVTKTTSH